MTMQSIKEIEKSNIIIKKIKNNNIIVVIVKKRFNLASSTC